jgi:hypothetical protein
MIFWIFAAIMIAGVIYFIVKPVPTNSDNSNKTEKVATDFYGVPPLTVISSAPRTIISRYKMEDNTKPRNVSRNVNVNDYIVYAVSTIPLRYLNAVKSIEKTAINVRITIDYVYKIKNLVIDIDLNTLLTMPNDPGGKYYRCTSSYSLPDNSGNLITYTNMCSEPKYTYMGNNGCREKGLIKYNPDTGLLEHLNISVVKPGTSNSTTTGKCDNTLRCINAESREISGDSQDLDTMLKLSIVPPSVDSKITYTFSCFLKQD